VTKRSVTYLILFSLTVEIFILSCTSQRNAVLQTETSSNLNIDCKIIFKNNAGVKHKAKIEGYRKGSSDTIEYRIYKSQNELSEVGEFIVDTLPVNCATIKNHYLKYPRLINKKQYLLGKFITNEVIYGDTVKYIKYYIRTNLIQEIRYESVGLDSTAFYFNNGKFRGYRLGVIGLEYLPK
jgi:dGTP triphosphohydrolase